MRIWFLTGGCLTIVGSLLSSHADAATNRIETDLSVPPAISKAPIGSVGPVLADNHGGSAGTLLLQAESSNAMGVTGDLQISNDLVIFGNGAIMQIEPVAPDVYRVTKQPNGPLVEGNTLCGNRPVLYMTLHRDPAGLFIMNLTTAGGPPATPRAEDFTIDGTCAVYVYQMK